MTRAMALLLSGIFALSFAVATPALALNPQPLPPGIYAPNGAHGFLAFSASRHGQLSPCRLAKCRR
jgi:hypothetical protein